MKDSETDYLYFHTALNFMISFQEAINGIEGRGVKVFLTTFPANIGLDILHDVEFAVQPVLLLDASGFGLSATKLTDHGFHPERIR